MGLDTKDLVTYFGPNKIEWEIIRLKLFLPGIMDFQRESYSFKQNSNIEHKLVYFVVTPTVTMVYNER